ncbi:hypothetical protein KAM467_35690 [Aeromonas caviae]|uniref:glycosyltransferase family 4 protein n=1 Tax=Aeromonas caviae TaxID=648 RepID=UPI001FC84630|nr:glycosyltransferase [Aeromonas caviae]GKR20525.1 hypothetical protein KAM467_35690 [Aeromonas caviae]
MSFLINASNLHNGGGVQVAASFISELPNLSSYIDLKKLSIICSSSVDLNIPSSVDRSLFRSYDIVNIKGFNKPDSNVKNLFDGFDKCFTVFGPIYFDIEVNEHICGFAQPWIAYPKNSVYSKLSVIEKIKSKIKFLIQKQYFKSYDKLVVEAEHVKNSLMSLGFKNDINVIGNCTSPIFNNKLDWLDLTIEIDNDGIPLIGFIGRAYPHKNIDILKRVNTILEEKYSFECAFLFTLNEQEMKAMGFDLVHNFYTVGEIKLGQCPFFYNRIDALIFPSLLECFSASPIEAMKMKVPVIGSNLPFVTEFCQDAGFYFDPLDPDDIARVIYNTLTSPELIKCKVNRGVEIINSTSTSHDRATKYINLFK